MNAAPQAAWIIDYRTARTIFVSQNNKRISHCVDLCSNGNLYISQSEEENFRAMPALKAAFLTNAQCVLEPDTDTMNKCVAIAERMNGLMMNSGNESAIIIAGEALAKGLNILSDSRSTVFATPHSLCKPFGIVVLNANEYFSSLP